MSRAEHRAQAMRLRHEVKLLQAAHEDAKARLEQAKLAQKQAEIDVDESWSAVFAAREAADQAERVERMSPGGLFGEPSTLGTEILSGAHGQSAEILAQVVMASTFWDDAWYALFNFGRLLKVCRSHLWREAVLAAVQARVTPELVMRFGCPHLVGLMCLGSQQQKAWALQSLLENRQRYDDGSVRTYHRSHKYTSLLHALKVHNGVPAVLQLLQDGESGDDSLPSPRVHAARLLYAIASRREPGFGRDEFGIDACELINAHGRLIRLPLPQPLVKRAVPDFTKDGNEYMDLSPQEVTDLPDDARMHVFFNGEAVDTRPGYGKLAPQCAMEWPCSPLARDLLLCWRLMIPLTPGPLDEPLRVRHSVRQRCVSSKDICPREYVDDRPKFFSYDQGPHVIAPVYCL